MTESNESIDAPELSIEQVIEIIQPQYNNVGRMLGGSRPSYGMVSQIYLIDTQPDDTHNHASFVTNDGVVARIHDPIERPYTYVEVEIGLLEILNNAGLKVPRVINRDNVSKVSATGDDDDDDDDDDDGDDSNSNSDARRDTRFFQWTFNNINGDGVLFHRARGDYIDPVLPAYSLTIARFLGQWHNVSLKLWSNAEHTCATYAQFPWSAHEVIERRFSIDIDGYIALSRSYLPAFASSNGEVSMMQAQVFERMLDWLSSVPDTVYEHEDARLPRAMIHSDLHRFNVLWHDDGELSCVLDWDEATYGVLLVDIGACLIEWCAVDLKFDWSLAVEFLRAYESIRPFEPLERAHLLRYIFIAWLLQLQFLLAPDAMLDSETTLSFTEVVPLIKELLELDSKQVEERLFP